VQVTLKDVETKDERDKLMFEVSLPDRPRMVEDTCGPDAGNPTSPRSAAIRDAR
jgi:hypothetical protein